VPQPPLLLPALKRLNMKRDAARILSDHALTLPYEPVELIVTSRCVYEPSWSTAVSTQLLDRMFPIEGPMEVLHFTKPDIFPKILKSGALWLAPVSTHLDANEYRAFLKQNAYSTATSKKIRRELAGNFYYASFTAVGSQSADSHWNVFADGGTGYCLGLHLDPKAADLRRIQYLDDELSPLTALNDDLKASIGRTFAPRGVARLTAFSLFKNLQYEDEIRLLVTIPPAEWKFKSDGIDRIAIEIGTENPLCNIELKSITCGRTGDIGQARDLADSAGFSGITVYAR
jgi:hypothetical protein